MALCCFNFGGQRTDPSKVLRYSEADMQAEQKKYATMEHNLKNEIERLTKLNEDMELTIKEGADERATLSTQVQALDAEIQQLKFGTELNNQVRREVQHFFNLKDMKFMEDVFQRHADKSAAGPAISQIRLGEALKALGMRLSQEEIDLAFNAADVDSSGGLNLEEFRRVVETPTKLEEWVSQLPLSALLGRCLSFKDDNDPLKHITDLNEGERQAVVQEFSGALRRLLDADIDEMKKVSKYQAEAQESGVNSKFQTTFKMSAGKIDDFHKGLAGRVGAPHPELDKGMRLEHCEMAGCDDDFTTSNYGVCTTPRKEYEITVDGKECPDADREDKHGKVVRVLRKLVEVKELKIVRDAKLSDSEIAAVVLYTGPMFQIYNTILRRYPQQDFQRFHDGNNLFSSTIHVLVSAVMKVSRAQTLPSGLELYRGLGGLMDLPEGFYRADERGCRGCMEWGFLSTTSDKTAALEYSGLKEERPLPKMLRMTTGSADRPACICDLSQYPGEREYLFVPCSYLEPLLRAGRTVELVRSGDGEVVGAVEVVTVRVNANLKGQVMHERRSIVWCMLGLAVRVMAKLKGQVAGLVCAVNQLGAVEAH